MFAVPSTFRRYRSSGTTRECFTTAAVWTMARTPSSRGLSFRGGSSGEPSTTVTVPAAGDSLLLPLPAPYVHARASRTSTKGWHPARRSESTK